MSVSYLKNYLGFALTDDEMHDIPYPYVELHTHVFIKAAQVFGTLGTLVIGPVSAIIRSKTRSLAGIKSSSYKCGKWGVIISLAFAPVMTQAVLKGRKADRDSVYDRCYRLRNNRGQVRVDRGSAVGAVSGAALAGPVGATPLMGALFGMSAGFISMGVYNSFLLPKKETKK